MDCIELCNRIFALDRNVRFAGILNEGGKLIAGGMREGLNPLVGEIHVKRLFNQLQIRQEMDSMFDKACGRVRYSFTEREKIKQLTFYLGEYILFVTLEPQVRADDAVSIASSITHLAAHGQIMFDVLDVAPSSHSQVQKHKAVSSR